MVRSLLRGNYLDSNPPVIVSIFHPNQHFSNRDIKETINSPRIALIRYWIDLLLLYSTAYYDVASATEYWLYLL